jgi:hypothetical protein
MAKQANLGITFINLIWENTFDSLKAAQLPLPISDIQEIQKFFRIGIICSFGLDCFSYADALLSQCFGEEEDLSEASRFLSIWCEVNEDDFKRKDYIIQKRANKFSFDHQGNFLSKLFSLKLFLTFP